MSTSIFVMSTVTIRNVITIFFVFFSAKKTNVGGVSRILPSILSQSLTRLEKSSPAIGISHSGTSSGR
jgi:hypothetical protein